MRAALQFERHALWAYRMRRGAGGGHIDIAAVSEKRQEADPKRPGRFFGGNNCSPLLWLNPWFQPKIHRLFALLQSVDLLSAFFVEDRVILEWRAEVLTGLPPPRQVIVMSLLVDPNPDLDQLVDLDHARSTLS